MTYFPIWTDLTSFVLEYVQFQGDYMLLGQRETTTGRRGLVVIASIAIYCSYGLFLDFYANLGVFCTNVDQ